MSVRPWRALGSYAIIKISSSRPEEFLNAAWGQGIRLDQVQRVGAGLLLAAVRFSDVGALDSVARNQAARLVVLREPGWLRLRTILEERWAWVAGGLIAVGLLYLATQFVWFIQVAGVTADVERQIRVTLGGLGVQPGLRRSQLNAEELQRQLLLQVERLTWVSAGLQGTILRVQARERIVPETLGYGPADLVARKDALVLEIIPLRGSARVQVGQMVLRGEVMVAGVEQERPVRADAVVTGKVWYEAVAEVSRREVVKHPIGPPQRRWGLALGRWQCLWPGWRPTTGLPPHGPDITWEQTQVRRPWRWGTTELPWAWLEVQRVPVRPEMVYRQPEQAQQLAKERAWQLARQQLPPGAEVLENTEEVQWLPGRNVVRVRVVLATAEPIGTYRLRLPETKGQKPEGCQRNEGGVTTA